MNFKDPKLLILIIILIAIFLRLVNITSEQIWEDEAISITIASSSDDIFWNRIINDIHPPLYYFILRIWILLFGNSIFSCRLLSVIFSIFTIPILYLTGKEIKNETVGLIIIFLYSISPFSIYYANEIRAYSLIHLLFTCGLYNAIKCIKIPEITKNYIFLMIIGILLIYTHYMGIVYFGILFLGVLLFNKDKKNVYKKLLISIFLIFLVYIPWLPYAIEDFLGGAHGYAGGRLNLISFFYWTFNFLLSPIPSNINDPYVLDFIILTFIINIPLMILSIISMIGFLDLLRKDNFLDNRKVLNFIIFITFLLLGLTISLGIILENTFTAKNLIGLKSIIYIFEALGISHLFLDKKTDFQKVYLKLFKFNKPNLFKNIIYSLIIVLLITNIAIYPFFRATYLKKPDWDSCFKKIKKEFEKTDIIILSYDGGEYSDVMEYYSNLNNFDLKDNFYELIYNDDEIEEFFNDISKNNITRIWIINFWQKTRDPDGVTKEILVDEYDLEEINEYNFRLDITLTLYDIP